MVVSRKTFYGKVIVLRRNFQLFLTSIILCKNTRLIFELFVFKNAKKKCLNQSRKKSSNFKHRNARQQRKNVCFINRECNFWLEKCESVFCGPCSNKSLAFLKSPWLFSNCLLRKSRALQPLQINEMN